MTLWWVVTSLQFLHKNKAPFLDLLILSFVLIK
jgi:hypothetical protein